MLGWFRRWRDEWRPSAVTLGAPVFPLLVLFGLNTVDELDRAAFAVLLPEIRDSFGLDNAEALAIVSVDDRRRAAHRGAVVVLLRPAQSGAHRHRRRGHLGDCSLSAPGWPSRSRCSSQPASARVAGGQS